jgi:RND family efflux transporter MFP subunit
MRAAAFLRQLVLLAAALPSPALLAQTTVIAERELDAVYATEGVVQAVRQSTIAARLQGRVLQVLVRAGDGVEAGQLLLRIDDRELTQGVAAQQAQLAAAQAQLANAEAELTRTRELVAQRFMSAAALDQRESQARAARAQVAALQAALATASTTRGHADLRAPYAAVIASVAVEQGDMVSPGVPLMNLYAPGDLRIVAQVPQARIAAVRAQAAASFEAAPGQWQAAGTLKLMPAANAATQTTEVRLEQLPAAALQPGQSVRVLLATGKTRRLVLPQAALLRRGELLAVYVQTADGRFLQRLVRVGEDFGSQGVEVLAGLRAGEIVALDPVKAGMQP